MSNKRINLFVSIMHLQNNYPQRRQGVFQQREFQQRNLKSMFLTSLMGYVQKFGVLSIRCAWSFDFILIVIQMDWPKLDSSVL